MSAERNNARVNGVEVRNQETFRDSGDSDAEGGVKALNDEPLSNPALRGGVLDETRAGPNGT